MREEVDLELGKVMPLLTSAEEAMAKVNRDDINQLRSFPNPPLPAAKVVESLIFLFN
jgi:dynein heavy chain